MKNLATLFLLAVLAFAGISAMPAKESVTIKISSHCDHFEACETGKSRLEKELAFTKGVKEATFDCKAMTVTIRYNPKRTSPQQLREAISKAGYDADDVKADPKGEKKLDECCQPKGGS